MSISTFVREQIDKIAHAEGFTDYAVEQESGSKHGDGFMATIIAVTLTGQRKVKDEIIPAKLDLICKLLPNNKKIRESFDSSTIFKRELYVYNKIFNVFDQFQSEKEIPIADRFTEYPKCYAAVTDVETGEHVIIMENMKSSGYELRDKMKPVDYDTVCLYMKAVGKLHALSFALRDQKPELFKSISDLDDVFSELVQRENNPFIGVLLASVDKGLSVLDQPEEIRVLKSLRDQFTEKFALSLTKKQAGEFYVIGYGDSWNNNLFYSYEGSINPQKICLLDWQDCRCASPGLDITYYLMSSTNSQIRERYYDLLEVYYDSMSELMTKLGSDTEKWFTFNDLVQQLRTVGQYGVLMAPSLLQIMVTDPKDIVKMDDVKDAQEITELTSMDYLTTQAYKKQLSDVIKDAILWEWI